MNDCSTSEWQGGKRWGQGGLASLWEHEYLMVAHAGRQQPHIVDNHVGAMSLSTGRRRRARGDRAARWCDQADQQLNLAEICPSSPVPSLRPQLLVCWPWWMVATFVKSSWVPAQGASSAQPAATALGDRRYRFLTATQCPVFPQDAQQTY